MSPAPTTSEKPQYLHASSVAIGQTGALIIGKSGAGKSALALALIGMGAKLISDDITKVSLVDNVPVAHAPERLFGVIEARGAGLIHVPYQSNAVIHLVVDLAHEEAKRLPPHHETEILGCKVRVQYRVDAPYYAAAIFQILKGGRYA